MAKKKKSDRHSRTHMRATTNGRTEGADVVSWDKVKFAINDLVDKWSEGDGELPCLFPRLTWIQTVRTRWTDAWEDEADQEQFPGTVVYHTTLWKKVESFLVPGLSDGSEAEESDGAPSDVAEDGEESEESNHT
ncbi:hypothetical protein C8R43DRAFT_945281 [Mycena crocata]|nr:hypothetical protein C8R43DRAFT_945281 [Mycena crocata]